jgi:hypothetical protein
MAIVVALLSFIGFKKEVWYRNDANGFRMVKELKFNWQWLCRLENKQLRLLTYDEIYVKPKLCAVDERVDTVEQEHSASWKGMTWMWGITLIGNWVVGAVA